MIFKTLLSNKHLQVAVLVFSASSKSHEEMPIISKGSTDHSLNSLCHKQII